MAHVLLSPHVGPHPCRIVRYLCGTTPGTERREEGEVFSVDARRRRSVRRHRVGVAFSEGPKLLPFYENLAKWQLLPLYAHILSVTFTVLPQTHNFVIARESSLKSG